MDFKGNFEIGRVLHLKSEIRNRKLDARCTKATVQSAISDFGFEMQDSSDFEISLALLQFIYSFIERPYNAFQTIYSH